MKEIFDTLWTLLTDLLKKLFIAIYDEEVPTEAAETPEAPETNLPL